MWIDLPEFSASIVAHNKREDLLVVRFRTCADADGFINTIDQYTFPDDIEQHRAFIYGTTPGPHDYPYRIMVRRAYIGILLFDKAQEMRYDNFKEAAHFAGPGGVMNRIRNAYLMRKWLAGKEYGEVAYNERENRKGESTVRPVYEPAPLVRKGAS